MDPIFWFFVVLAIIILVLVIAWITWLTSQPSSNRPNNTLPTPPQPLPNQYVLQFINQTNQTLLLGAQGPVLPITPRSPFPVSGEKWTLPAGSNIILDVPVSWYGPTQTVSPRFWVRTGCRYDPVSGFAQCESGDCSLSYDCLTGGKAPVSLIEFCFNCGQFSDEVVYDVSLVDGFNVGVNVIPIGGSSTDPHNPTNPHWNITNICNGGDLRSICPVTNQITSSQLGSYIPGSPNNIVACLSNCGRAAYPTIPSTTDPRHSDWVKYCCQEPATSCTSQAQCPDDTVCWSPNNINTTCQCHGWIRGTSCSPEVCTFQTEQPPFSQCTDCVGDDTFHSVCPFAYSWPNENQNQVSNAKIYQIVFTPNTLPITGTSTIPNCQNLPASFNSQANIITCGSNLGQFSGAHQTTQTPSVWDCSIMRGQNTTGVLCRNS